MMRDRKFNHFIECNPIMFPSVSNTNAMNPYCPIENFSLKNSPPVRDRHFSLNGAILAGKIHLCTVSAGRNSFHFDESAGGPGTVLHPRELPVLHSRYWSFQLREARFKHRFVERLGPVHVLDVNLKPVDRIFHGVLHLVGCERIVRFPRNRFQFIDPEKNTLLLSCSRRQNRTRPVETGQKGYENRRVERTRRAKGDFEATRTGHLGEGENSDQKIVAGNQVGGRVV